MAKETAFLGMGIMGGSMAANLARAGFKVRGWNRTPDKPSVKRAADAGVEVVNTAAQAVADAQVVFLCLTDVEDIREVLLGANGIAAVMMPDAIVVDMSTTGPQCAKDLSRELGELGLRFMDAPVSGGDVGAKEGSLTIMVGGDKKDFEEMAPWFQALGKSIWYCGQVGNGQAVKLCNQVLCAVNMVAVCESFYLAHTLGINPQLVVDVCESGAGGSWALSKLGRRILRGDLAPGFKIKDMLKDLRLVSESVESVSEALPGTALADSKFIAARVLSGTKGGDQGTQTMIRTYGRK